VRISEEVRSFLRTLGNASLGVLLGLAVLGIGFLISHLAGGAPSAVTAPSPTPTATPRPTAAPTATLTIAATAAPTPAPPPTATVAQTAAPLLVTAYSSGGRRYAALRAPVGYVYTAPFAGTIQVRMYQLIDGDVRLGSNVTSLPYFPYVTLTSLDRRLILRPGAIETDTQLLVEDGARVSAGAGLFKAIGDGPSSWATFYDRSVTASVIASLAALPGEIELDPVALFAPR